MSEYYNGSQTNTMAKNLITSIVFNVFTFLSLELRILVKLEQSYVN